MFNLIGRENAIFEILEKITNENLDFIIVGGYAVSAYKHRFSVDADIIIKKEDKEKFKNILSKNKFSEKIVKELNHIYSPEFIRYEKKDDFVINVDLLIDGIGSRATDASFSFDQLKDYSKKRKIIGSEKEIIVLVPNREMLIVLKLHSGRLTDIRDIVALSKDINFDIIKKFLWRGKKEIVKENIKKVLSAINNKNFIDSFKGAFIEKKFDINMEEIKKFKDLI